MGEVTALQDVGTYELTDMLQSGIPGVLVLVGEHSTTGEVILDRVNIHRCDAGMLS